MNRWVEDNTYYLPSWELKAFALMLTKPTERQEMHEEPVKTPAGGNKPVDLPTLNLKRGRPVKEDWTALLREYQSKKWKLSGEALSIRDFCREKGISERTFRHVRNKVNLIRDRGAI